MTRTPLVSIITCFLNEINFLKETIESILKQEYKHWELLLVDDGSSDGSSEIAKQYANNFSNIIYLTHEGHENRGLSASRNLALNTASGEYISFLDADDVWLPGFLSQMTHLLQQNQVSMVCEASEYWTNWNGIDLENRYIPIGTIANRTYSPPQLFLNLYPLGKGDAPCPCGILVKKKILNKHLGFDETFKGMYEDQVLLCKFYLNEFVYISSGCNNKYRQRKDSLVFTSHVKGTYYRERKFFLEWLEEYLAKFFPHHKYLNELVNKALFPYRHPWKHFIIKKISDFSKLMLTSKV